MTAEEKKSLQATVAKWSRAFILERLNDIVDNEPCADMSHERIESKILEEIDKCSDILKNDTILHGELDSNAKIKHVKTIISEHETQLKEAVNPDTYFDLMLVIKKAEKEVKWRNSKQGKLVFAIEEWVEKVRSIVPEEMRDTIIIGRNLCDNDPCNIIIGGYSDTMSTAELESFFMSKNPPVEPLFAFTTMREYD
jgi:hypothetical protein